MNNQEDKGMLATFAITKKEVIEKLNACNDPRDYQAINIQLISDNDKLETVNYIGGNTSGLYQAAGNVLETMITFLWKSIKEDKEEEDITLTDLSETMEDNLFKLIDQVMSNIEAKETEEEEKGGRALTPAEIKELEQLTPEILDETIKNILREPLEE